MALVDLHRNEVEKGWMPPVCAWCGASGDHVRAKTFTWGSWSELLLSFFFFVPYFRLMIAFQASVDETNKRVTLHLPFCLRHRNHWRWRSWPSAGVFLFSLGLIGIGAILEATRQNRTNTVGSLVIAVSLIGLAVSGILAFILPKTGIHVIDMAGAALTLDGVSEKFGKSVVKHRLQKLRSANDEEEEMLLRRRQRQRICNYCSEKYVRGRLHCPHCGTANDLIKRGSSLFRLIARIPGIRNIPEATRELIGVIGFVAAALLFLGAMVYFIFLR